MLKATTIHIATARYGVTRVETSMLRVIAVTVASTFAASSATVEELHPDDLPEAPTSEDTIEDSCDCIAHVVLNEGEKAISFLESLLASLDILLSDFGLPTTAVVCAALAVTVLAFILVRKSGGSGGSIGASSRIRRNVLFVGPCGSGKTAMMHKLCHGRIVPTVTSMQSCRYSFRNDPSAQSSPLTPLVDFPGHERLRGGVEKELRRADRVVFVIDGSSLMAQVVAGAELLYDILLDPSMEGCRGLLVALNKSDLKEVKPARARTLLQKELEKLRETRGTLGTQGEENEMPMGNILGRPGHPFDLEVDSPCEVQISSCSVKDEGALQCVLDFISASTR